MKDCDANQCVPCCVVPTVILKEGYYTWRKVKDSRPIRTGLDITKLVYGMMEFKGKTCPKCPPKRLIISSGNVINKVRLVDDELGLDLNAHIQDMAECCNLCDKSDSPCLSKHMLMSGTYETKRGNSKIRGLDLNAYIRSLMRKCEIDCKECPDEADCPAELEDC